MVSLPPLPLSLCPCHVTGYLGYLKWRVSVSVIVKLPANCEHLPGGEEKRELFNGSPYPRCQRRIPAHHKLNKEVCVAVCAHALAACPCVCVCVCKCVCLCPCANMQACVHKTRTRVCMFEFLYMYRDTVQNSIEYVHVYICGVVFCWCLHFY